MIFSRAELAELARPPSERMAVVIAEGEPTAVGDVYEAIERDFRSNRRNFQRWEAGSVAFLSRERTYRSFAEDAWIVGAFNGVLPDDVLAGDGRHRDRLEASARSGTAAATLALYRDLEGAFRRLHDAHTDLVARLWSAVYRSEGPDGLEGVLTELWEGSLAIWMERDRASAPRDRLPVWTATLHANFARFEVEELTDCFRITQAPCGTCVRQLQAGAYGPPENLAVVTEAHPVAFGVGTAPIYRTHVAVMHNLLPVARIGSPWPRITCPNGLDTGPCVIELDYQALG